MYAADGDCQLFERQLAGRHVRPLVPIELELYYPGQVVAPYPWRRLARVSRREVALWRALTRRTMARRQPALGRWSAAPLEGLTAGIDVQVQTSWLGEPTRLIREVGTWGAVVLSLTRGPECSAYLAVPNALTRALSARLPTRGLYGTLDSDGLAELPAPRPMTMIERGIAAMVAAALLDDYGLCDVAVKVSDQTGMELAKMLGSEPAESSWPVVLPVQIDVDEAVYIAHLLVPAHSWTDASLLPITAIRPMPELFAERGAWLARAPVSAAVAYDPARLPAAELRTLQPGDVIAFAPTPVTGALRVFVGHLPVTIDRLRSRIRVLGGYRRSEPMGELTVETASELLGDDAEVSISCIVGQLSLSVRQVLELQPGQVLPFGVPVGGQVTLACGGRAVARGQLVDIEGEIGVRVLAVYETTESDGESDGECAGRRPAFLDDVDDDVDVALRGRAPAEIQVHDPLE